MPSLVGGGSGGENASANTVKSRLHQLSALSPSRGTQLGKSRYMNISQHFEINQPTHIQLTINNPPIRFDETPMKDDSNSASPQQYLGNKLLPTQSQKNSAMSLKLAG